MAAAVFLLAVAALVAAAVALAELRGGLGLLVEFHVHEVAHVVRADVENLRHAHAALDGRNDLGEGVDLPNPVLHRDGLLRGDQVQLVQDDLVGESNLLVGLVHLALLDLVVQAAGQVLGVRHSDDGVQPKVGGDFGRRHEGPDDGHGVRHARRLDQDGIDGASLLNVRDDLLKAFREVASDGAAHAAVVHDHDLLSHVHFLLLQERVIDGDLTELVLDDGDLLLLLLLQDVVEKGGLPRAEEACQDGDGDLVLLCPGCHLHDRGLDVAVDAERVGARKMHTELVVRVQCLLVVLDVPQDVDLQLQRRPQLGGLLLEELLALVHELDDRVGRRDFERVRLRIDLHGQLHGRVKPHREIEFVRHGRNTEHLGPLPYNHKKQQDA
mmetsp:Transcript_49673/g.133429  ORF Transcript_49673/g.133429 Transcript_49673/m.133429 type:complete len:383 (+) Transcript_49673:581-1729(+)